MFFAGLAGVAHETIVSKVDRPELLIVFAAMMGLPAFFKADEGRSRTQPRKTAKTSPAKRTARGKP